MVDMRWVVAGGLLVWYFVAYHGVLVHVLKLMPQITFKVLVHQTDQTKIKETVRNLWQHLGLVGALLLTIALPMFLSDSAAEDDSPLLAHLYLGLAAVSSLTLLQATLESAVHLVYTEALNDVGVLRYCVTFYGSIGGPVLSMGLAALHLCLAMIVWALLKFGAPNGNPNHVASHRRGPHFFLPIYPLITFLAPERVVSFGARSDPPDHETTIMHADRYITLQQTQMLQQLLNGASAKTKTSLNGLVQYHFTSRSASWRRAAASSVPPASVARRGRRAARPGRSGPGRRGWAAGGGVGHKR